MIALDLYLAFVLACVVLIVIPGPNVALIVANSVAHGARFGLLTVAGTSSAVVVQLSLTVLGASAVLNFLAASFDWLRWLGVVYLVWLGIAAWRAPAVDLAQVRPQARSARRILVRGFLVVAVVLDSAWALLAGRLRALLMAHVRLRNRLTGGLLVGASVGLALARRP